MAQVYTAKDKNIYIALSNLEKRYIFTMGANIIRDVHKRTTDGTLPPRWNDHDINALEIPLLCEPLENNGPFIDLQIQQIHKLDKALVKLYSTTFEDLFDIDIDKTQPLSKEEVFIRMEEYRELKSKVEQRRIINTKDDLLKQSGLFL